MAGRVAGCDSEAKSWVGALPGAAPPYPDVVWRSGAAGRGAGMPRSIWKGAVSFGLVSIAVKLYSATEEKDIRFHQVHRTDGGRIKYKRVCSIDGEEVSYDDIAKGYDVGGGELVILTDDDFADLPLTTSRAIDVLAFVPADQIDPIM